LQKRRTVPNIKKDRIYIVNELYIMKRLNKGTVLHQFFIDSDQEPELLGPG